MIKTGYKVLNNDMNSSIVLIKSGGKRYFRNRRNFPKNNCGPLCVFTNLKSAQKYCGGIRKRIFKCRYKKSINDRVWNTDKDSASQSILQIAAMSNVDTLDVAFADWIELKKEIKAKAR